MFTIRLISFINRSFFKTAYTVPRIFLLPLIFIVLTLCSTNGYGQMVKDGEDESRLYAQTKQINQFFRRFNGEEDEKGERYYPNNKQYRNVKLRKKYLSILFDENNGGISKDLQVQFAKDVLEKNLFLNFHGGNWFAEVHTIFTMNGKDQPVTLFMELEKHHQGTRWIISKVYADMFEPYFKRDTTKIGQFLHPLSHELAFMNLRKAFNNPDSANHYINKRFRPDHSTLFLYEVKRGNLRFKTVEDMKFHFFQAAGWYFELSLFNRPGYNTGWLISNLVKINTDKDKEILRKHLYYEK
ncbi:hypothetical protein [Chryseosolibacter indicus]|uniref:DUF547 domain-containing protein n=1 Tax=Chryseosolibacter indicus TaxID=2782351 RepID=A0ABS5VN77_9BACT|nr:hypothetical protein [Chryseosolibacter indicus]MBT1702902.1 hypothetical protein [Chryseosolibacter indicus]